ncbi:MAG: aminotransferase class I/II-fold pyridoxal phosphate-dependent enzyme [Treponema sp.]|nr:aminotransferase class I/II-fold pyridoxal phosphate-dependent enzyme [Treponema sp.]
MSVYWNSRIKNICPYVPGEQPGERRFIKLNTNENPYPPSPKVLEAIVKAADERLRLYPDPECMAFREAVARRYKVRPSQVFAGNGSDEVLAFAFGAFFESGGPEILFPDITYSFYPVYADLWNVPYRTVALDDDFLIRTGAYETPCGGAVFPNPNAPTGTAITLRDILSLAGYLEKREKILIIDEAYAAFIPEGTGAGSAAGSIEGHPNLLTVHTLSKSASLAGLRAGFAIGDEKLIEGLRRVRDSFNSYTMDRLALAGAEAAVQDAAYYDDVNRRVAATRDRTAESLRGLGCTVLPSAANFIFMKAPGPGGAEFLSALREKGILVRHFNKDRIAGFLRVSIGTDEDMDAFLAACGEIIAGYRPASNS